MTTSNTSLMEKIRKLLRVTVERGATEAEAASAAQHVRRLLDAHNLTLLDVAEREGKVLGIDVVREFAKGAKGALQHKPWMATVGHWVARLYDCKSGTFGGRSLHFIGDRMDVEVASEVYLFIVSQLRRMRTMDPMGQEHIRAWYNGAARRVGERINQIILSRNAPQTTRALVVRKETEIDNWMEAKGYKVKKARKLRVDAMAYSAGYVAGGRVQIHKEVE